MPKYVAFVSKFKYSFSNFSSDYTVLYSSIAFGMLASGFALTNMILNTIITTKI